MSLPVSCRLTRSSPAGIIESSCAEVSVSKTQLFCFAFSSNK